MAPKRKTRAQVEPQRQQKRGKVDITDYSAWGWVGSEVIHANEITSRHVLATCGFSAVDRLVFHPNRYTGKSNGLDADGAIVVEDDGDCNKKTCKKNSCCLNFLGQEQWDNHGAAKKAYLKHRDLGEDPRDKLRGEDTPVGLENLGATCYANAFLQVWFRNTAFRQAVFACQPFTGLSHNSESPIYQLQVTFAALQCSNAASFNPIKLVESLKIRASEQQDAQEFSKLFLSHLEGEFKKQEDPALRSLITTQFEGRQVYVTSCHGCQRRSERASTFLELEVSLEPDTRVEDRIQTLLAHEVLNGNNQYFCEQCNSLQDATRSMELSQLPPVLHVSLLRFVFDPATMERKKSKHVVSFPPTIDMAPFLGRQDAPAPSVPSPQQIYQLRGVLLHKGASAYHGHYQAEIHDDSVKKWFSFNDEIVTEMKTPFVTKKGATSARMQSRDAYMLVYTLVTEAPAPAATTNNPAPPAAAFEVINHANKTLAKEISDYEEKENGVMSQFDDIRRRVMDVYCAWVPDPLSPEHTVVVSRQALEAWLSRPLKTIIIEDDAAAEEEGSPTIISNATIVCSHGKLNPTKAQEMKCIRNIPEITSTGYVFSPPPLSIEDVCRTCVEAEFMERIYAQEHPAQVKAFDAADEDDVLIDDGIWISKAWLKDWRLQKPKMHVAGALDPSPGATEFIGDTVCEHGELTCDKSLRIYLSAGATSALRDFFPTWQPVSRSDVCAICEAASNEADLKLKSARQQAALEKVQMKHTFEHALDGTLAYMDHIPCAVMPISFVRAWKRWVSRPGHFDRPSVVDTRQFLCEHKGLIVDLNSHGDWTDNFVVVKLSDWESFMEHYFEAGPLIAAQQATPEQEASPCWYSEPTTCQDCRTLRKSTYEKAEIKVRIVRQSSRAAANAAKMGLQTSQPTRNSTRSTRGGGQVKQVTITPSMQVKDIKLKFQEDLKISTIAQCLMYKGEELSDNTATVASIGILIGDELELHVIKEDTSLLDEDIDMGPGDQGRSEGMAFEGTLLGVSSRPSTPGSDVHMAESGMLTCPTCTFANGLAAEECEICNSPLL